MTGIADLIGWRAVILHRLDDGIERMVRQLDLLGLTVHVQWAARPPGWTNSRSPVTWTATGLTATCARSVARAGERS